MLRIALSVILKSVKPSTFAGILRTLAAPLMAVIIFAAIGIYAIQPPSPEADEGNGVVFSINRALAHVRQIAREPHPVESQAHAQALQYLVEQLRALPLEVQVQPGFRNGLKLTNVLARPRNPSGGSVVLLVAHYDSVPTGPGAADDTAGIATLLETARLLASEPAAKNEVAFLFTDGEELGMLGAHAFVQANPEFLKHVRVILNFEARGNRGPVMMFETGPRNLELMRLFRACPYPVATSFAQDVYHRMPNNTDLSVFKAAGLTGYNFAPIMGLEAYHGPGDTWQNLDHRTLAHYGSYATTLTTRLAHMDLDSLISRQDGIFFPLFRGMLVVYPESWAVPLAVGACIAFGIEVIFLLVRRRLKVARVLAGFVPAICIPALMTFLASLGLQVLKAVFPHKQYGSVLLLPHSDAIAIVSLALVVMGVLALKLILSRRFGTAETLAGALMFWLALALITAWWLPGFSYLLLWPALGGMVALWLVSRRGSASVTVNAAMICSVAPGCLLFSPALLLAHHALTIGLLPVLAGLTSHALFLVHVRNQRP